MTNNIQADAFAKALLAFDNIAILTHGNPDGDTVGTGIALLRVLQKLGKTAYLCCADALPEHLAFLMRYAPADACFFGTFSERGPDGVPEHVVSVDVASGELLGAPLAAYASRIELALDHHEVNTLRCENLLREKNASSAGEVLYDVILALERRCGAPLIDRGTASALYAAIASDSGSFKYSSTSGKTLRAAGALIDAGAENAEISRRLFDIKSLEQCKAEALCVENAAFFLDGKLAFSYMTGAQCRERQIPETCFDTCSQLLRMIKGVEVGVFAKEKTASDGTLQYRLSFRSNEYADVSQICAAFGGGGHKRAAGCTVSGRLDEVQKKIAAALAPVLLS